MEQQGSTSSEWSPAVARRSERAVERVARLAECGRDHFRAFRPWHTVMTLFAIPGLEVRQGYYEQISERIVANLALKSLSAEVYARSGDLGSGPESTALYVNIIARCGAPTGSERIPVNGAYPDYAVIASVRPEVHDATPDEDGV